MTQPQYDMQAHGEQIRHQQIARYNECERREEEAAETAILALVEIDGSELLQMCADDPALDARLVILMERIAMMGTPANNSHYHDDALRAAHDLHRALLAKVRDARVKAVRS